MLSPLLVRYKIPPSAYLRNICVMLAFPENLTGANRNWQPVFNAMRRSMDMVARRWNSTRERALHVCDEFVIANRIFFHKFGMTVTHSTPPYSSISEAA